MTGYPSLHVAYVDDVEEPSKDRLRKIKKVYYSALVKPALPKPSSSNEPGQSLDQVLYSFWFAAKIHSKFIFNIYLLI